MPPFTPSLLVGFYTRRKEVGWAKRHDIMKAFT